jgi:hypothetical protein
MSLQYNELNESNNEIRLIRFLRNSKTPLQISLSTVSKDEAPRYHCLSYVWGDPTPVWPIVVDDTQVQVTHNLGEALQRVSEEQDVEFLWADALCINQMDEDEKLHQVYIMSKIYSEAIAVLAWLGPEADSSGNILDEISRVGAILIFELGRTPYPKGAKASIDNGLAQVRFVNAWLDWPPHRSPRGWSTK